MATSQAVKLQRLANREREKERLFALLADPLVLAVLTTAVGLYGAERVTWSDDEGRNSRIRMAVEATILYAALTRVGAKGWPAALAAVGGGLATGGSGAGTSWSPLQAGEATLLGAGVGSIVPGVGTIVGAGVGLGVDTVYQWVT
jgi:hypothetical protein